MNNSKKMFFHIQNFGIEKDRLFYFFLKNISKVGNFNVECSLKFQENILYPCRFNFWFNGDAKKIFLNCMELIKKIELNFQDVKIGYDCLENILSKGLDSVNVRRVVLGVDFRDEISASRIKIWLVVDKYDHYINSFMEILKYNKKYNSLFYNQYLLFGFDFCFDGKNLLKVYPVIFRQDFNISIVSQVIDGFFGRKSRMLMDKCDRFHIGIKEDESDFVLHFHPENWFEFICCNEISFDDSVKKRILELERQDIVDVFISLKYNEIKRLDIRNVNFYYM